MKRNNLLLIFVIAVFVSAYTFLVSAESIHQAAGALPIGFDAKELKSEHFIIKYEKGVDQGYVLRLKEDAEYFYRSITQEFNLIRDNLWMWDSRAKIFIAKDQKSFLKNFNCPKWSGACVNYYDKRIYTFPSQRDFSLTLKHELTHIIFREYVGYNRLPLWLDEGMATYIQYMGESQQAYLAANVKELIKSEKYIPFANIDDIYKLEDDNQQVGVFYTQSFSMVSFLMKRFGRFHFKQFLRYLREGNTLDNSFRRAFVIFDSMEGFERRWKEFYQK